ncbi:MAG: hypothetical protein AAGG09_06475 [Pseudomonadota bacterium]
MLYDLIQAARADPFGAAAAVAAIAGVITTWALSRSTGISGTAEIGHRQYEDNWLLVRCEISNGQPYPVRLVDASVPRFSAAGLSDQKSIETEDKYGGAVFDPAKAKAAARRRIDINRNLDQQGRVWFYLQASKPGPTAVRIRWKPTSFGRFGVHRWNRRMTIIVHH